MVSSPRREGRDNGTRTLLAIQEMKGNGAPGLLLSIDAEKAFDRVDWGLMQGTWEEIGLGEKMIRRIKALYNRPTERVKINGIVSEPFEMFNGTRQGCPLSPLLFVLASESLLARVRPNPDRRGIKLEEETHKLAAYADDILFYVTSPKTSLPNLMKTLKEYGEASNLKINPSKSETLTFNIPKSEELLLQKSFAYAWGKKRNKVLRG